jgi:hypothetical protein
MNYKKTKAENRPKIVLVPVSGSFQLSKELSNLFIISVFWVLQIQVPRKKFVVEDVY